MNKSVAPYPGSIRAALTVPLLLLALMLTLLGPTPITPSAGAAPAAEAAGVTSVVATDDQMDVTGTVSAGTVVEVYALGTEQEESAWADEAPVATVTADGTGAFAASVPRDDAATDPFYEKFVAVVDGALIGTYHYVDDLQTTPMADYPYPEALSKKGLQVQMTDDAEELGNQHAGINMPFDQLMQLEDEGEEETITFVSRGREFYFDRAEVEASDRQIKPLSDNGEVVNLILLVYASTDPNSAASVLIHPDADPAGGPVFGFNTETAEGVAHYTAAVEFVTQRYTRDDASFGRATGFIVGNEIDAQWTWANMGEKPLEEFLLYYERALRITDQAARTAYGQARTYTSLTHCWTIVCGPNEDPAVQDRYYEGRDVIDGLNAISKEHGDYPWFLAHHPYPENLFDPAFWEDTTATDDVKTTPRITFKNIELLPDYLADEDLLYQGEPRRIILSEQGCNTANNSQEAQELQAACYALAYYKVRFLDSIDSFILHRHVDYKTEGGLRLGLWTWDDDRPEDSSPDERKVAYDVFRYIDTERSLEVTDFALDVIGIDDWSEAVPGWDPEQLAQRPLPAFAGVDIAARRLVGAESVSDFTEDTDEWRVSDNATSVTSEGGDLVVAFDALASLWRGTDVVLPQALDVTETPFLSVTLDVPADSAVGTRFAKVKAYGEDGGEIADGTARLTDDSGAQRIIMDLSEWPGGDEVTRVKVWVRGSTNVDWAGELSISEIVVAERIAGSGPAVNVEVSAAAPEGPAVGSPVELTVTNNDRTSLRASLRLVACDGVELSTSTLKVNGLAPGDSRTLTATIEGFDPADPTAPVLCLRAVRTSFEVDLEVAPPTATPVFDFDDGTVQGWQAGEGMQEVAAVTSILNGPGGPQDGSHLLDGTAEVAPAVAPKTMFVEPEAPLELSEARELVVFVNSYGGVPGATGYEVTFTAFSGEDSRTLTQPYSPDSWTEVSLDVFDWAGRDSVERIEVTMNAVGTDFPGWDPHVQIDSLGYYDRPRE